MPKLVQSDDMNVPRTEGCSLNNRQSHLSDPSLESSDTLISSNDKFVIKSLEPVVGLFLTNQIYDNFNDALKAFKAIMFIYKKQYAYYFLKYQNTNINGYDGSNTIQIFHYKIKYNENIIGLLTYHSVIIDTIKANIPFNCLYIEVLNQNTIFETIVIPELLKLDIKLDTK